MESRQSAESRTLVIAVVPPQPARQLLRDIMEDYGERLGSRKALYLPPHITVVNRFRTRHADEALTRVRDFAQQTMPFIVRLDRFERFKEPRILHLVAESDALRQLHDRLLETIVGLREPWGREELDKRARSPRERELLERYGSPYVKEFFAAHMTIAGPDVNEAFDEVVADAHLSEPMAFPVRELAVLEKTDRWHVLAWIPLRTG